LTPSELATAKTRRTPELQLGLALHIGVVFMTWLQSRFVRVNATVLFIA